MFKAMTKQNEYLPESVSHPGITLAEKLEEIGMSQKEFAVRTGKPEQTIVKVINGDSAITPDMAVQFEDVLRIPASFWLNRQRTYDEAIARNKRQKAISAARNWARDFPYTKMALLGWVPPTRKWEQKVEALLRFFGVSSHDAWEDYYYGQKLKVNFRISLAHTRGAHSLAAWLRQGEVQAREILAQPYDPKKFEANLAIIRSVMARHPENFFRELQTLCGDAGVIVVYTPCLPGAPIHGSTRWINDTPLIQLSARYKRNDIFWFTFFHEAGHILNHGKKYISLENVDYDEVEKAKEEEADQFAIKMTFSEEQELEVLSAAPLTEHDIINFAEKFGTHPAIIIGRFQHRKQIAYHVGRQFLMPVSLTG